MPRAAARISIGMSPDALWGAIGAFGAVGRWHPLIQEVTAEEERPGALRTARTCEGDEQVERLLEVLPDEHRYRYEVVSTPLPVRDCVGELRVEGKGDGTSHVEWSSEFDVTRGEDAEAVGRVRAFLESGLDNLKRLYG